MTITLGLKVRSEIFGEIGTVETIYPDSYDDDYPVLVRFPSYGIGTYTRDGRYMIGDTFADLEIVEEEEK